MAFLWLILDFLQFSRTVAQPELHYSVGAPCDLSNGGQAYTALREYNASWPTQCDILCDRFSPDGESFPCESWTWSKTSSLCSLYDVKMSMDCVDVSDLQSTWAVKRYILDRNFNFEKGYLYSKDGVATLQTWHVCSGIDPALYAGSCDGDQFGAYAYFNATPILTMDSQMYAFQNENSFLEPNAQWQELGKIWLYRKNHGGFKRAIKRSSAEGLYGCLFPSGVSLTDYEDDLNKDETNEIHLYFCMDQYYCPEFFEFDMCFVEYNGCYPELKGNCGEEAKSIFSFFSAWVHLTPAPWNFQMCVVSSCRINFCIS